MPVTTPAHTVTPAVRDIPMNRPFTWLAEGWWDMVRGGWLSLAHGFVLTAFGALLVWAARDQFWWLAGAFSGFLVVAPVLATSLYAISRALEHKQPVNLGLFARTWTSWQRSRRSEPDGYWSLVRFGLLLAASGTVWVLTSAAFITLMAGAPINTPTDFLHRVVLADNSVFEFWMVLGGLMAAPLFASSVIAMPLLLDRKITLRKAVLTSWNVVLKNPGAMAMWAFLLMAFTLLAMLCALVGLIFIIPVLGHASWHAYRDLVDVSDWPARDDAAAFESAPVVVPKEGV